jgi:hypothetical protein
MLDFKFLFFLFNVIIIGCEQKKAIVEEYDKNILMSHAFKMLSSFASLG